MTTTTNTYAITLRDAAEASAREIAAAAREPIAGIDELLAMDDELEAAASHMIDEGWARSDVRRWISEGIEASRLPAAYPEGLGPESASYACDGPRDQQERELRRIIAACAAWPTDEARDLGMEAEEYLDELREGR